MKASRVAGAIGAKARWSMAPAMAPATETPEAPANAERKGKEGEGKGMESIPPNPPAVAVEKKPRTRNELLDTLAGVGGGDLDQIVTSAWTAANKRLTEIKQVCPDVTPDEIKRRAANYKRHYPTMTVSPHAIAMHWAKCDEPPADGLFSTKGRADWAD